MERANKHCSVPYRSLTSWSFEWPSAAYALVSAKTDPAAGIFRSKPGQIVREYPPLVQANGGRKLTTAAKAVEANWAFRRVA